MKRLMTIYIIFSIVFLVLVYVITFIQETQRRSTELFYEISRESLSTNDFDAFAKYQSVFYQQSNTIEIEDYDIIMYHIIGQNGTFFQQQLLMIVKPKSDVDFSKTLKNEIDQTGAVFKNIDENKIIIDTKQNDDYQGYAVSYGIELFGFYYYSIDIEKTFDLEAQLYDFNGNLILNEVISISYAILENNEIESGFLPGYTNAEIKELLDINTYLVRPMMINIALFLGIDIIVGSILYFFLKKKKI